MKKFTHLPKRLPNPFPPFSPHDRITLERCRELSKLLKTERSATQIMSRIQTLQRQQLKDFLKSQSTSIPGSTSGNGFGGGSSSTGPLSSQASQASGASPKPSIAGSIVSGLDETSNMSYMSEDN